MRELTDWIAGLVPELGWGVLAAVVAAAALFVVRALVRPAPVALREAARDGLLLGALALVAVATLTPVPGATEADGWQLRPFSDLLRARSRWASQLAMANLLANAALFMPLGVALALRFARAPSILLVASAALVSVGVEALQRSTVGRASDVTDVIMNTIGAAAGLAVGRLMVAGRSVEQR